MAVPPTFLISYDLEKPGQDYEELFKAIRGIANGCAHLLGSVWLIGHKGPAEVIRDELRPHIDDNDRLLVVKLTGAGAWAGLTTDESQWLMSNL